MQVIGDSVHIREARVEDAEAICRLSTEELGYDCSPELVAENFRKLQPDREKVFVAVSEETILGFVHVEKYQVLYADAMANILGLAVNRTAQYQGIGRALMSAAEQWAKENGIPAMRLNSGAARTGAHAFYRAVGYTETKRQARFFKELAADEKGPGL